jgi:hypothetical protein
MSLMTGHSSYTRDAALHPVSPSNETPMSIAARLAELGTGAWIALTIIGFILWWPVGLALFAFTVGSGRMAYRNVTRWQEIMEHIQDAVDRMGQTAGISWRGPPSSGNRAFDEYRAETVRRLEEEHLEFKKFLRRLRQSKDKAEFDMFMAERRNRDGRGDIARLQV